jgi:hypothetical protein
VDLHARAGRHLAALGDPAGVDLTAKTKLEKQKPGSDAGLLFCVGPRGRDQSIASRTRVRGPRGVRTVRTWTWIGAT